MDYISTLLKPGIPHERGVYLRVPKIELDGSALQVAAQLLNIKLHTTAKSVRAPPAVGCSYSPHRSI